MDQWYYYNAAMDTASGPYPEEALRALHEGGVIQDNTLVSKDGGETWLELATALPTPAPPLRPSQIRDWLWQWRKFSIPAICALIILGLLTTLHRPSYSADDYRKMAREYTMLMEYATLSGMQITEKDESRLRFYGNLINSDPAFSAACQAEVNSKLSTLEPDYAKFGHR